jgi:ribosomal protein L7Ae-like RNA K-turn-binding protein
MDSVTGLIGLAARARQVTCGLTGCLGAVRAGRAKIVVMASDAGGNGRKKLQDKCASYGVPLRVWGSRETLGRAVGSAWTAAVAITSAGFAEQLVQLVPESDGGDCI